MADWSTNASHCVICTTAEVAQAAKKVMATLYLTVLLGEDIKPIPTQTSTCLRLFLLGLNSSYPAVMEVTECPRTSA